MGLVKDPLGLSVPGLYRIPCSCEPSYIGQMGRNITMHLKEHQRHLRLGHVDKSALVHHGWTIGHSILFDYTKILGKSSSYDRRIVREAIEIRLVEEVINKEDRARLSALWLPALELLKVMVSASVQG